MAVYIVTGKLGSGKTLLLVMKILEYLKSKRRVAVNVDVKMEKLCRPGNKHSRLVRLPDLPSADDLVGLGFGHDTYDEEMFGGIFLDEAGVWLNSRDWNQGGRTELLKFFLFLRKRRWDLWLCVQNVNVIDKQIRESIAEHVVYINRWDRLKIPFIFRLVGRVVTLGIWKGYLPKMHQAIVKYGAKFNSPKVDDWFYQGKEFYGYYDTTQEYNKGYDKGAYSMLPPGYLRRRIPSARRDLGFVMRTTKIFFRRTRIINALFLGGFITLLISFPLFSLLAFTSSVSVSDISFSGLSAHGGESISPLSQEYSGFKITSYIYLRGEAHYRLTGPDGNVISTSDLISDELAVIPGGPKELTLLRGNDRFSISR